VPVRVERVHAHGDPRHSRPEQRLDARVGEEGAVRPDDDRGTASAREGGDRLEVVPQEGLAAGEDEQRRRIERQDLLGDPQALVGAQLGRGALVRARGDVAVRALQVAPAREIPGDYMWDVVVARVGREGLRLVV
jgi:hypothetical protein